MRLTALLLAAGGLLTLAATSSSAMPVSNLGAAVSSDVEQARVVCNRWGRCWRTGPRYGYYAPRYHRPYAYRPYGYGYRPYYGYGPGIGFGFRF